MTSKIYVISWYDISVSNREMILEHAWNTYQDMYWKDRITLWMKDQGAERVDTSSRNNKQMYIFTSKARFVEFVLKWL